MLTVEPALVTCREERGGRKTASPWQRERDVWLLRTPLRSPGEWGKSKTADVSMEHKGKHVPVCVCESQTSG
ncbi:unnamed protein product [Tetraodon nigroviridis]|uniref:(spotted green pufferfish) hypothetical protein n=1 Tax=Tetraodon nigroviridis TaxID=99883 RepID=Q4RW96_TETNG|nr:unnamed protein product [Tetraodon nigroviridis]